MKIFTYKAKDQKGQTASGTIEAGDINRAKGILHEQGLMIISLSPKSESGLFFGSAMFGGKANIDDKVNFTRQLATMTGAGLPITQALGILEMQAKPGMRPIIRDVLREIEGGSSLSAAFEKHVSVFGKIYISLIKAGETAGVLNDILNRLADNMEKQRDFRRKIKGAMVYPMIIIGGMFVVVLVMMIFVVPKLTSLYEEFQAKLPMATRILVGLSKFTGKFFWLIPIIAFLGFIGARYANQNKQVKEKLDELSLKIPVIGPLRRQMALTEFARTLGLLIGSGILVIDALNITIEGLESEKFKKAVRTATASVQKGTSISSAITQTGVFPPLLSQMIAVGEETGKLDEILEKVSTYFEQEAEGAVKTLTTAMEPIIMVLMGVGVGFLMIAIIMPIYQLTSQF